VIAIVPAGSTVIITQIVSPKKFPVAVDILHLDSYIPGSHGEVISTEISVAAWGARLPARTLSVEASCDPDENLFSTRVEVIVDIVLMQAAE